MYLHVSASKTYSTTTCSIPPSGGDIIRNLDYPYLGGEYSSLTRHGKDAFILSTSSLTCATITGKTTRDTFMPWTYTWCDIYMSYTRRDTYTSRCPSIYHTVHKPRISYPSAASSLWAQAIRQSVVSMLHRRNDSFGFYPQRHLSVLVYKAT